MRWNDLPPAGYVPVSLTIIITHFMRSPLRWFRQLTLALGLSAVLAAGSHAQPSLANRPARPAPDWLRNAVIYEISPRNFSAAGNFNGITAQLDALADLGVTVLWLMPIHPIGAQMKKGTIGSPYAVRDYYGLNPDYGTAADFKRLVAAAHQRGLKVIIDLVANHTAWDSVMMAHPEFYRQDAAGKIIPPVPEWTDVAGLNYGNPKLREYMIAMLTYWVREFDVDGFRCDVAGMVPTDFWEQARAALEKVKPGILMLAEASKPELLVKAFDLDYAWPLHATLNRVLLEGAPASELQASWEDSVKQFPRGALHLRISDNHDEARAVAVTDRKSAVEGQSVDLGGRRVMINYNGMEVGDATESGDPALFEKMPVFWHPKERPPLRDIYRDLIKLRRQSPAFRNDRVTWLENSAAKNVVSFLRADAKDEYVIVINFSNRPQAVAVTVPDGAEFKRIKIPGLTEAAAEGFPQVSLNGFEWRIYHRPAK